MTETIDPMTTTGLATLGWDEGWAASFAAATSRPGIKPARVVAVHRETSIVRDGDGDRTASVSGAFRFEALAASDFPTVGDWVAIDASTASSPPSSRAGRRSSGWPPTPAGSCPASTTSRSWPRTWTSRSLVAGLDNDFNLRRIERYLAVAWSSEVLPVVVLNKADLADDVDGRVVAVEAIAPGVAIVPVSAWTGRGMDDLRAHLRPGATAAILGSSGVGKSTLVNALLGEDRQATAAVRGSDSRGRHTTTHRELFELPGGALLVDTPGIRALEVLGAEAGLEAAFDEVAEIAATCRFSDCGHESEPGCAVRWPSRTAGSTEDRLESFRKLQREQARVARQEDPRARAESRRTWKLIHKSVNEHMKRKYGDDR